MKYRAENLNSMYMFNNQSQHEIHFPNNVSATFILPDQQSEARTLRGYPMVSDTGTVSRLHPEVGSVDQTWVMHLMDDWISMPGQNFVLFVWCSHGGSVIATVRRGVLVFDEI